MSRRRIFFRVFPFNRLSFPVLLQAWESVGLDREFDIFLWENPATDPFPPSWRPLRDDDVFLYSFMTPHLPLVAGELQALAAAAEADRCRPLFAAGGPHASGDPESARVVGFTVLFVGPGEDTFPAFGRELAAGRRPEAGTVYQAQEADELERGLPISHRFAGLPPLEIMRGCNWRCRYCQTGGRAPQYRSLDSIRQYLTELKRRGFRRVSFISPSALQYGAVDPRRPDPAVLEELLRAGAGVELLEYGIFPSEVRPDQVSRELLELLRRFVANKRLTIGAQSASTLRLQALGRGHDRAAVENAVAAAHEAGFAVNLDFILALPDESPAERFEAVQFIRDLHRRYALRAHLHHFFPLAGSAYERRLPAFLGATERAAMRDLELAGCATNWWVQGERTVKRYFSWLGEHLPHRYAAFR